MLKEMLTVSQKFAILEEAEHTGSLKIMVRKHKLQKIKITNWSAKQGKFIEKRQLSRKGQTIHTVLLF